MIMVMGELQSTHCTTSGSCIKKQTFLSKRFLIYTPQPQTRHQEKRQTAFSQYCSVYHLANSWLF